MYKTNTNQPATDNVIYFAYWFVLLLNKKRYTDIKGKANLLQHKQLVIKKCSLCLKSYTYILLEDNKHDSSTLKQFSLHYRHRCQKNSNLILMVFLFWVVFPFLLHHLLHHIHNTYYTRYCQNNRQLIVYLVLKTSHNVANI